VLEVMSWMKWGIYPRGLPRLTHLTNSIRSEVGSHKARQSAQKLIKDQVKCNQT